MSVTGAPIARVPRVREPCLEIVRRHCSTSFQMLSYFNMMNVYIYGTDECEILFLILELI